MVSDFLKEVKGCEIADWKNKTDTNPAINAFNQVKGTQIGTSAFMKMIQKAIL